MRRLGENASGQTPTVPQATQSLTFQPLRFNAKPRRMPTYPHTTLETVKQALKRTDQGMRGRLSTSVQPNLQRPCIFMRTKRASRAYEPRQKPSRKAATQPPMTHLNGFVVLLRISIQPRLPYCDLAFLLGGTVKPSQSSEPYTSMGIRTGDRRLKMKLGILARPEGEMNQRTLTCSRLREGKTGFPPWYSLAIL